MIKPYPEAQVYATPFYEKSGFRQVSGEFLVDGIQHIINDPAGQEYRRHCRLQGPIGGMIYGTVGQG